MQQDERVRSKVSVEWRMIDVSTVFAHARDVACDVVGLAFDELGHCCCLSRGDQAVAVLVAGAGKDKHTWEQRGGAASECREEQADGAEYTYRDKLRRLACEERA